MCIKSDAKNRQQYQKWLFIEANRDGTDAESPFPFCFSFSASFKNSSPSEKVAKLSSFWDRWAESLFVSIIIFFCREIYYFPLANNCCSHKKKIFWQIDLLTLCLRYQRALSRYWARILNLIGLLCSLCYNLLYKVNPPNSWSQLSQQHLCH